MNSDLTIAIVAAVLLLVMLISFIFTFFIINHRKKEKLILEKNLLTIEYEQSLLHTQIEIQEQTLTTISQEIHDNIGQVLSLAKLHLNTFPLDLDTAIQTKVDDTRQLVSKAISDLRDLSRSMHGDKVNELGLEQAIASELKILQNTGQFQTNLLITGSQFKLDPKKEMVLFRIVQESLNNAIKHSGAKNICVQLQYEPSIFRLNIIDNGVGFNMAGLQSIETGIGLKSMDNRATLIGGKFFVHSDAGAGTSITIEIKNH